MLIDKIIPAVAAVAIGAAAVMSLPGFSPEADASTPPKVVKSDRLDLRPIGADCSPQAWPYYERIVCATAGRPPAKRRPSA